MRKLTIYEAIDDWDNEEELEHLAQSLDVLKHQNMDVERCDLDADPAAFESNADVSKFMKVFGPGRLPLVQVDGVTVFAGRYPDDADLIDWLELPPEVLGYEWADLDADELETDSECGCGCGHEHHHHDDGCGCGHCGH